jgi:hypothetical protein
MRARFQFSLRRALLAMPLAGMAGLFWREAPNYVLTRDRVLLSAALLIIAAGIVTHRTAEATATAMIVWCVTLAIM